MDGPPRAVQLPAEARADRTDPNRKWPVEDAVGRDWAAAGSSSVAAGERTWLGRSFNSFYRLSYHESEESLLSSRSASPAAGQTGHMFSRDSARVLVCADYVFALLVAFPSLGDLTDVTA